MTRIRKYTYDQDMIDLALGKTELDTWQPIGGIVGAIVDKAKQKRDNRALAEWAGYEDDDLDEWLF